MSEPRRPTFLVSDLVVGKLYRDALSGRVVLVLDKSSVDSGGRGVGFGVSTGTEPRPARGKGRWWNPVQGKHEDIDLVDHQLVSLHDPLVTELLR